MSSVDQLHESKCMFVKDHNEMLSKQIFLSTRRPTHINHLEINPAPPTHMKETLTSRFATSVRHLLQDNIVLDYLNYKEGLKHIHTESMSRTIQQQSDNKVLGVQAPQVSSKEKFLPRKTRCTLSQLRSGYSTHSNSFLARINPLEHTDTCQNCEQTPHNTNHLFQCPANSSGRTPQLWRCFLS